MNIKSIYRRAADNGLLFGVFLSVLFLLFVFSTSVPLLSFLALVMLVAMPGVIFYFLRRCYIEENGFTTFSSLWMLGILIFIFGSLICGAVTYVYLQYIAPTFIYDQAKVALDMYRSIDEMKGLEFITVMEQAVNQRLLPTAIQFVIQMIWMTTFFGSLLSMAVSLIVRAIKLKNQN